MRLIAVTHEGLEDACAIELGGSVVAPGHVEVESEVKALAKKRTVKKILMPLAVFDFSEGIYEKLSSVKTEIKPSSFSIEPHVWGNSVRSVDVAKKAGQAFVDRYGWKVDLDSPALVFRVSVVGQKVVAGVDMTKGVDLSKRVWEPEHDPLIAAAMVLWSGAERIMDTDCGDGTVIIEAALLGKEALGIKPKQIAKDKILKSGADTRVKLAFDRDVPFQPEAIVTFGEGDFDLPAVFFSARKHDTEVLAELKGGKIYRKSI